MKLPSKEDKFAELRKEAEKIIQRNPQQNIVNGETKELIHDLQVHHVELEMQNEELREIQNSLEKSRDRLSLLYHQAPCGYLTVTAGGMIKEANHTIQGMLNRNMQEILRHSLLDFILPEDQQIFYVRFKAFFKSPVGKNIEVRLVPKNSTPFYASIEGRSRMSHQDNEGQKAPEEILMIVSDITQRKEAEAESFRLETQLRQSQKMEAVGVLAGGIAHEFNNILYAILGYTEMHLDELPELTLEEQKEYLANVFSAGKRAKKLVQQILTFSRAELEKTTVINMAPLIKEALQLLRATLPATIEIQQDIDFNCRPILAEATQIHQVIMNLCTNARQAMIKDRGILMVSLKEVTLTRNDLPHAHMKEGDYLCLIVKDTGSGIPSDIMERIFDPFFTTKEVGKGTGLGLSVVHKIVENHKGSISIKSPPGEGTTFTLFFPLVDEPVAEKRTVTKHVAPHGKEHILVVEDEEVLCRFYEAALKRYGYQVSVFNESTGALEAFLSTPEKYDLVITDQAMPVLTGEQLSKRFLALRPDLPIILITGYSEIFSEEQAENIGIREYIIKPVAIKELQQVVRTLLDAVQT
ncbi:MAG: response regulator [SAR324 cluster bacterium]|nr:response regulator [SAR324 cluster bacterium]